MEQIYCITKQTYVVITLFCRGMAYVPFTPFCCELHFVVNTLFLGADFYADIWDLTQIFRRYLGQKSAADSSGPNAHTPPLTKYSFCFLLLEFHPDLKR